MQYVVRLRYETNSGEISQDYKAFSRLPDAQKRYRAAWLKIRPTGPILDCGLYEVGTDDARIAIEAAKAGTAHLLDADREFQIDPDDPIWNDLFAGLDLVATPK